MKVPVYSGICVDDICTVGNVNSLCIVIPRILHGICIVEDVFNIAGDDYSVVDFTAP